MNLKNIIGTLCLTLTTTSSLLAQGIIGNDYVEITASYVDAEGLDGYGATVFANSNYKELNDYGVDLYFGGSASTLNDVDVDSYLLATGGVIYMNTNSGIRPYVDIGLGYTFIDGVISEDSYVWAVGVGVEFEAYDNFTITPEISYADAPDIDASDTDYSVRLAYWFNASTYGTFKYTYTDIDAGHANSFDIGVGIRY